MKLSSKGGRPDINEAPLSFWQLRGYTDENVRHLADTVDTSLMAARVTLHGDGNIELIFSRRTAERREGHAPTIVKLVQEVCGRPSLAMRKGSFVIWLEDGVWEAHEHHTFLAPVLSFGRTVSNYHTFVIPDPAFIDSLGYQEDMAKIRAIESGIGFENKKRTVFFRGAAVGPGIECEYWSSTPRARISLLSRDLNNLEVLDAKMTKMDHLPAAQQELLTAQGVIGDYVQFHDFLKYLYLIHADGYHCSWPSLFTKLATESVVVRIVGIFEQWYYWDLVPWKHYVPLAPDLRDFNYVYEWLAHNDGAVREIIRNAHAFIEEQLGYEHCLADLERLIGLILDCRRG